VDANMTAVAQAVTYSISAALHCSVEQIIILSIHVGSLIVKFGTTNFVPPESSSDIAALISSNPSALAPLQNSYQQLTGSTESISVHGGTSGATAHAGESVCAVGCILAIVLGVSLPALAIAAVVVLYARRRRAQLRRQRGAEANEPVEVRSAAVAQELPERSAAAQNAPPQ
jgi:hypothetical protein